MKPDAALTDLPACLQLVRQRVDRAAAAGVLLPSERERLEKVHLGFVVVFNTKNAAFAGARDAVVVGCAAYWQDSNAPFPSDFRTKAAALSAAYHELRVAAIDAELPTGADDSLKIAPTDTAGYARMCQAVKPN